MGTYRLRETSDTIIAPALSALTNRLLLARGVTADSVAAFLSPNYETELHDPFLLYDMDTAVVRIMTAMEANECIVIYSDYDCDGIPGAVVLHDCFTALGYSNFINYIPHRHYEGFGLNTKALDTLKERGATLLITIDCGTSDVEAITYANQIGIDVIVTDHHEPPVELPEAAAIVNPKLGGYPFPDLCGAAVVFKLAQALLARTEHTLLPGTEKWWLDMVGIATVADMVPLTGENRVLAHYGLKVLRKSKRPGLQKLLQKNRVDQRFLTEEDIGFTIGPRINAASRMDTPEDAFHMLRETDVTTAGSYVDHLEKLNKDRKAMVGVMTKELNKRLEHMEEIPAVLVIGHPDWRPALVGLAANKLAEQYHRPVFLWGRDGNGVYKGSCRSGGTVSVVTLMNAAAESFLEHGGHHFSGGFSVRDESIFSLSETLNEAFVRLGNKAMIEEEIVIDAELLLDEVTNTLMDELTLLAPFGTGNAKPLFSFQNSVPRKMEQFGKEQEHLKLVFETKNGTLEAIAFFAKPNDFVRSPMAGTPMTLIGHLERSYFMNRPQLRIRVVDCIA